MTDAEIVRQAHDRFENGKNWVKGTSRDGAHGRCLVAMLQRVALLNPQHRPSTWRPIYDTMTEIIAEEFPDRWRLGWRNLAVFNDDPATEWPDVDRLLTLTEERLT